jgi:hypothetical protein
MIRIAFVAAALFASASAFACPGAKCDEKGVCPKCAEHKEHKEHKEGEHKCNHDAKEGEKDCKHHAKGEHDCKNHNGKSCPFAEKDAKKSK